MVMAYGRCQHSKTLEPNAIRFEEFNPSDAGLNSMYSI